MNWKFWRNWFKPKIIVMEIDPNSTPRFKALHALLERNILVVDYIWLLKIPTRQGIKPGQPYEASKSEIKRWCDEDNVVMNGRPRKWDEKVEWPVTQLVLFPKGKTKTSII